MGLLLCSPEVPTIAIDHRLLHTVLVFSKAQHCFGKWKLNYRECCTAMTQPSSVENWREITVPVERATTGSVLIFEVAISASKCPFRRGIQCI